MSIGGVALGRVCVCSLCSRLVFSRGASFKKKYFQAKTYLKVIRDKIRIFFYFYHLYNLIMSCIFKESVLMKGDFFFTVCVLSLPYTVHCCYLEGFRVDILEIEFNITS